MRYTIKQLHFDIAQVNKKLRWLESIGITHADGITLETSNADSRVGQYTVTINKNGLDLNILETGGPRECLSAASNYITNMLPLTVDNIPEDDKRDKAAVSIVVYGDTDLESPDYLDAADKLDEVISAVRPVLVDIGFKTHVTG